MFINDYHAILSKNEDVEDFRTTQVPHGITVQLDGVHHPLNFLRSIVIDAAFDG
jgi:hypothetical protein